jgi:hypothetical protein
MRGLESKINHWEEREQGNMGKEELDRVNLEYHELLLDFNTFGYIFLNFSYYFHFYTQYLLST